MALNLTAFTSATPGNYQFDSGVIYTGLTYTAETGFAGTLLGATEGGVEIKLEQKYRDVEVDGARKVKAKGNKRLETATAVVSAALKEFTEGILKQAFNATSRAAETTEAPTGYKIIEGTTDVADANYLTNLAVVLQVSGLDNPVIFVMDNAFATEGATIKTEDNKEATIPMTFEAHASAEQLAAKELPWRIIVPNA